MRWALKTIGLRRATEEACPREGRFPIWQVMNRVRGFPLARRQQVHDDPYKDEGGQGPDDQPSHVDRLP